MALFAAPQGAISVSKPYQLATFDWNYAAASGGISNTTTAVTFKAATGVNSTRNYVTAVSVTAGALGVATELAIRDGAGGTVLWRVLVPTGGLNQTFVFPSPLHNSANNVLLEVVTLTASVTGAVYFNAVGYTGP